MMTLTIEVETPGDEDSERSSRLASSLRRELSELPIESLDSAVGGMIPQGARSAVEAVSWSALAVSLGKPALAQLLKLVQSWVSRQPVPPKVTMSIGKAKLVIEGKILPEQEKAIQGFLDAIKEESSQTKAAPKKPSR